MLSTRLIPQLNCTNPVRVTWRGAAGIVTTRHVAVKEAVEKYTPLLDIDEDGIAGECTADVGGLVHWVAREGTRVYPGAVVAVIANADPIPDVAPRPRRGWVHTSDVLPFFALSPAPEPKVEVIDLPPPAVEEAAPSLELPFDVRDKSIRKTYYLSEKEQEWLDKQSDPLGDKATNVLRVAVAAFASLTDDERRDWMKYWKELRGVN